MKTSELIGAKLDYYVAKALGHKVVGIQHGSVTVLDWQSVKGSPVRGNSFQPSDNWMQGGAVIKAKRILLIECWGGIWCAVKANDDDFVKMVEQYPRQDGPDPLVAAMRAVVAAEFGEEVPDI